WPHIAGCHETGSDLRREGCAPSRTRTCGLLLRRHKRPSAVHTNENARHWRAKQPKAVVVRTTLQREPGRQPGGRASPCGSTVGSRAYAGADLDPSEVAM